MTTLQNRPPSHREPEEVRLRLAQEGLASSDPYAREAGAQSLAGLTAPTALQLLETACTDREGRVVEGALRALLASAATSGSPGSPEAEAALLRALTRAGWGSRLRERLAAGGSDVLGALPEDGYDARRFQFLAAHPDLARCRLSSLETGTYRRVQAYRSARLRANPSFLALCDVIRADPDLPRPLKTFLARRAEFITQGGQPRALEPFWEEIRRMTGLLAGFATDPALRALCELALERTAARQTRTLWSRLKTEVPYVPELVVGAGPHAANFCCALAILRPDLLPLVVERRERLGGQFAVPAGAAWRLNSRARPAAEDRRAAPGTGQALNAIGAYAPVQEADLTGQSYAAQDRLALAIRLSLWLSCQALVGTAFVERYPNNAEIRERLGLPAKPSPPGRYLIALEQVASGERRYLATDTILFAGGLGAAKTAFRDSASRQVLIAERDRERRGLPARYIPGDAFLTRLTDPNTPFPLRGLTRVIVVGGGDSAKVVIEALLGYGPPAGCSVNTLDRVGEVIWIGQQAATREAFLACERPRYHLLALEFPREGGASASARIRPIAERAARFTVAGDQGVVTTDTGARYAGNLVVDCTGFARRANRTPQPLAEWTGKFKAGSRLRVCDALEAQIELVFTCRSVITSVLTPEPRSARRLVEGGIQRVYGRRPLSAEIAFTTEACTPAGTGAELERCARRAFGLEESVRLYLKKTVLPVVYATVHGAKQPVARREAQEGVYYLGPQAGLPPPVEIVAERVGEDATNTVALWQYAGEVTAFAELYCATLLRREETVAPFAPADLPRELRQARSGKGTDGLLRAPVTGEEAATNLPAALDTRRLLRYLLCEHLRQFRSAATVDGPMFQLRLTPVPQGAGGASAFLEAQTETPVVGGIGIEPLLEALATDPLLQQAVFRLGLPTRAAGRTQPARSVTVEVEIQRGRFRLAGVQAGESL